MLLCLLIFKQSYSQENIPLPEHPRPDFERSAWLNLNGNWSFEFDKNDAGMTEKWFSGKKPFTKKPCRETWFFVIGKIYY